MGKHDAIKPPRPSDIRQTVKELAAMGCRVHWDTMTGQITFDPPGTDAGGKPDAFDMVDFRR